MTFDKILGWKKAKRSRHPRLRLRATTVSEDFSSLGLQYVPIAPFHIDVVADSGAQSCVWGLTPFLNVGFKKSDLLDVNHCLRSANKSPIKLDGVIILRLGGNKIRQQDKTRQDILFSTN